MDNRTIVGIDVSKATANVAVTQNLQVVEEFQISLDFLGFEQLKQAILRRSNQPEIVFEATGLYSRRLEYFLENQGLTYHILNPVAAKNRITSGTRRRKNDAIDARQLAVSEYTAELTPFLLGYKQDPVYRELKDMNRDYEQLSEDKKRTRNRVHRALQLTFASFMGGKGGFDPDSKITWELLTLFPHAELVRQYTDLNDLQATIMAAHFKAVGVKRAHQYAHKLWLLAAKNGDGVPVESDNTRQVRVRAKEVLTLIQEQADQIKRMVTVAQNLREFELLQTIPGIGASTAVRLISELGDVHRFDTSQQLNSFIGIDLTEIDSGDHQSPRHITKHGSSYARRILYWTVILMIGSKMANNHIRDDYQKRRGDGSKKPILVKEMGRLIKTILYLVKTNQPYSYELAPHRK